MDSRVDRGNRRVARVDDNELGMHAVTDDPLEDGGLSHVGLQGEDERHVVLQGRRLSVW